MGAIKINKLTNGNIYIDGVSYFGSFKEVTTPELKAVQAEHNAAGMIGKLDFPTGFDKLTLKISWNGPYPAALTMNSDIYNTALLQIRGNVQVWGGLGKTDQPIIINVTGRFTGTPSLELKQMENTEPSTEFVCQTYQLIQNGLEICYVNFFTQEYRVLGIDKTQQYRNNLGI
jgi:hypothetical protein